MPSRPESAAPAPAPDGPAPSPGAPGRGIVANALFGLLTQFTTAAFTLLLTLYLARALDVDGYGRFTLALSIGAIALWISDFGLASSAARFLAERPDDRVHVRRVLGIALRLKLVGVLGVGLLLAAVAPLLSDVFSARLTWPLRAMAMSLVFEGLLMLCVSGFGALRRVDLSARMQVFESVTETAASVALVIGGAGVAGAILGRATGYGIGLVAGAWFLTRATGLPTLIRDGPARDASRAIIAYAKPLIVVNGAFNLYVYVDSLLIGALLEERDVGHFNAALRLITVLGYVGTSVATAVAPRLAGDTPDVEAFARWVRNLTLVQALLIVPLVVWSGPIVSLAFGSGYERTGDVLTALAPYAFLLGMSPLISGSVVFFGDAARRVPIVLGVMVLNAAIDVALLPAIGVMGAAVGTGVAMAVFVPAHLRICIRRLGLRWWPMLRTTGRALVAATVAGGVLWAIGHHDLAVWQWALGALLAPTAYLLALLVLRELRPSEIRVFVAAVKRRSLAA